MRSRRRRWRVWGRESGCRRLKGVWWGLRECRVCGGREGCGRRAGGGLLTGDWLCRRQRPRFVRHIYPVHHARAVHSSAQLSVVVPSMMVVGAKVS